MLLLFEAKPKRKSADDSADAACDDVRHGIEQRTALGLQIEKEITAKFIDLPKPGKGDGKEEGEQYGQKFWKRGAFRSAG